MKTKYNEPYIYPRKSERKGNKGNIVAFSVEVFDQNKSKHCKSFKVADYISEKACFNAAKKYKFDLLKVLEESTHIEEKAKDYPTVSDLFSEVKTWFPNKSPTTYKHYNSIYRTYIRDDYASTPINKIKRSDILKTLNTAIGRGCTQPTIIHIASVWHKIYEVADLKELGIPNVSHLSELPKSRNQTERARKEANITDQDYEEIIRYAHTYGNYIPGIDDKDIFNRDIQILAMELARISGLRSQEVRALTPDCFEFTKFTYDTPNGTANENGIWLHIYQSIGTIDDNGAQGIVPTKTPQSKRAIPLGEKAIILYNDILNMQKQRKTQSKDNLLFANYDGKPFSSSAYSDFWSRIKRGYKNKTGKNIDIHPLLMRKAFASDLSRQGQGYATIQQLLGHTPGSVSILNYDSPANQQKIDAVLNRQFKH